MRITFVTALVWVSLLSPQFGMADWGELFNPADGQNGPSDIYNTFFPVILFVTTSESCDVGEWKINSLDYYSPSTLPPFWVKKSWAGVNIELAPGLYPLYTTQYARWEEYNSWFSGNLLDITQIGEDSKYAGKGELGKDDKTIAQRGCCICSLLSLAKKYYSHTIDISHFDDYLYDKKCYVKRDLMIYKAADLVGFHYLGRFNTSIKTRLQKYMSYGCAVMVRVKTKTTFGHWVAVHPSTILLNQRGDWDLVIMDPYRRGTLLKKTYTPLEFVILSPNRDGVIYDGCIPKHHTKNGWWNTKRPLTLLTNVTMVTPETSTAGSVSSKQIIVKSETCQIRTIRYNSNDINDLNIDNYDGTFFLCNYLETEHCDPEEPSKMKSISEMVWNDPDGKVTLTVFGNPNSICVVDIDNRNQVCHKVIRLNRQGLGKLDIYHVP